MKKVLFSLLLSLSTSVSWAQNDSSGIYLSADDYRIGKLTLSTSCQSKNKLRIRLNDGISTKPYITAKLDGREHLFDKYKIFGYSDCKKGEAYEIVSKDDIVLYTRKKPVSQGKGGFTVVTVYYFSTADDSKISALTRLNLKRAFPENRKFQDYLDYRFENDRELADFNKSKHLYKVVEVYLESVRNILNSNSSEYFYRGAIDHELQCGQ